MAINRSLQSNHYVILAILFTLAILFRFFHLNFQSLWVDELYSIIPTNPANSFAFIYENCRDQPPLYYFLLNAWFKLIAYSDYWGRFFSAVLGVFGVGAMYLLGSEIKDRATGYVSAFITALNFFHIQYSQEVRFYSLLFLLTVLSYLYFIRSVRKPALVNFGVYTITSIGLSYTHYFGPVVLIAQAITFLVIIMLGKRDPKFILYGFLSGVLMLVAYIPWLPIITSDMNITEFWALKPSPLFWGLYYYMYLGKDPYLAVLYLFFVFLAVKHFIRNLKEHSDDGSKSSYLYVFVVICLWIVISYLIPYLYSVIKIPILDAKYTIITLPALILLFATGWSTLTNYRVKIVLLITILISTCINMSFFNQYYFAVKKEQLREAAEVVIKYNTNNTKVYSSLSWFYNFYFRQYGSNIVVLNPTDMQFDRLSYSSVDAFGGEKTVWVLQGHLVPPLTPEQQQYLDQNFVLDQKFDFASSYAYLYRRK